MSYILSALRKAENERKPRDEPVTGDFIESAETARPATPTNASGWIILVLSLMLLAALGYLILAGQPVATDNSRRPGAGATAAVPQKTERVYTPAISAPEADATAGAVAPAPIEARTTGPAKGRESIGQVDPGQAPPLPALNITGYIYFESDPRRSKLFVDGIVYRLDSRLSQGLVLSGFARDHITVTYFGNEEIIPVR